jgi:ribose transport system substrate-binding protein
MQRRKFLMMAVTAALVVPLASCSSGGSKSATSTPASTTAAASGVTYTDTGGLTRYKSPVPLSNDITTRGQEGDVPVWNNQLQLTAAEVAKVKAGKYTAALVWHTSSPFMDALTLGATKTFAAMGIKVVSVTNANLSDSTLASNVQTVLALKPDIILSISLDPVADAATFQPAVDKGVKLVFASVKPNAYVAGKQYTSLVTYDLTGLGNVTADAMGTDMGGKGKVGMIYYDADFYVTNEREKAFQDELASKYPGIKIVDKESMADTTKAEAITSDMLTKHPEIKAIFAPWDSPIAESVVAALKAAGRSDVKVYTIDLGNTNALDMAKSGNIQEETSTLAVEFGNSLAIAGVYGVLGKTAPPMVIVPAFAVTKSNLSTGWASTFGQQLPSNISAALAK